MKEQLPVSSGFVMGQGQGKTKDGGGGSGGGAKVIKSKTIKHKATGELTRSRENLEEEPKDVLGNCFCVEYT